MYISSTLFKQPYTTSQIMLMVMVACLPGIAIQSYYFGYGTLIQIMIALPIALLTEGIVLLLRRRPLLLTLRDNSAMLTALLLAISIPAYAPWWLITIGTFFAIMIAKQLYGGLGENIFNPAMVGYVVLLIAFPVVMTQWPYPVSSGTDLPSFSASWYKIWQNTPIPLLNTSDIDAIAQATPLDKFKTALTHGAKQIASDHTVYLNRTNGWLWINCGFLLGGIWLLQRRIIQWQIPFAFLVTLTIFTIIQHLIAPDTTLPLSGQLFSGATFFGAFFIATDPVTAPTANRGRLIYGALIGFLVWLIRSYGGYPDGIAFAVLLANITVPLLDIYCQPKRYGNH